MIVCHVTTMPINKIGSIANLIFNNCYGKHIWCDLYARPPSADIYILHCFKNQLHFPNFILWEKPKSSKVISLIHSSEPCMPAKCSDLVVTISRTWQTRLKNLYNIDSEMIYGAIDVDKYKDVQIDYTKKVFGKITRPEIGKYYKDWNYLIKNFLNKNKDAECRIISNGYKKLNYLKHERMNWIEGVEIDDIETKKKELSRLSLYTECHNDGGTAFIDTFCVAMLEGMACGLPVVLYKGLQEPMAEVLGEGGIICNDISEYMYELNRMLNDIELKEVWGLKAKERAKHFNKEQLIYSWNRLLKKI